MANTGGAMTFAVFARAAVATALLAAAVPAAAQEYPTRPVRMIVGFAAGGGTDTTARPIAQKLSELFGQQVIVDNRPGAAGNIATDIVATASPDRYTILMATIAALDGAGWASEHGGGRTAGLCGEQLVRAEGPRQHAARDHRPAQRRDGESAQHARGQDFPLQSGPRGRALDAGGVRRLYPERARQMGEDRQGVGCESRMTR